MKDMQLTLALTIFLIAISLFVPIIMHFYSETIPTGKASTTQGTVTVNVTDGVAAVCGDGTCNGAETCTSCPADCGACPASPGGGGGGGGGRSPVTHILDFDLEDTYSLTAYENDKVKVIFSDDTNYEFKITWASVAYLSLELNKVEYRITNSEIGYFDFDNDGNNDLSVLYIGETNEAVWTGLEKKIEPTIVAPAFSKEKAKLAVGADVDMFGKTISLIPILIVLVAILIIFMMLHNKKLKNIEGHQKKKLIKIRKDYSKKKKTVEVKIKTKDKLTKQKNALERAYKSGYVKKDAYSKGKKRINDLMRKI